jgi:hypothetical protein
VPADTKARQADYYDHGVADPEFEINRPHGESRLYSYLMDFVSLSAPLLLQDVADAC